MNRYKIFIDVVQSAVRDQKIAVADLASWIVGWQRGAYQQSKDFEDEFFQILQDEGIFFDGVEEELLAEFRKVDANCSDLLAMPIGRHSNRAEAIVDEENSHYSRGVISAIIWDFKENDWIYKLGNSQGWVPEKSVRILTEQDGAD